MNNVKNSWCAHLIKVNDQSYDVLMTYDLYNHTTVPVKRRNKESTSTVESLHGQFSVLSALLTPFKLKIYNYSHRHHCESVVHSGSIIDIVIPKNCFIVLHCALVH